VGERFEEPGDAVADVVVETDVGEGIGGHDIVGGGVLGFMSSRCRDEEGAGVESGLNGLGPGEGNTVEGSTVGKFFKSKDASLAVLAASFSSSSLWGKLEEESSGDESVKEGVLLPESA
jgi:hypothetical protein